MISTLIDQLIDVYALILHLKLRERKMNKRKERFNVKKADDIFIVCLCVC